MKLLSDLKLRRIIAFVGLGLQALCTILFIFLGVREGSTFDVFSDFFLEAHQKIIHGVVLAIALASFILSAVAIGLEALKKRGTNPVLYSAIVNIMLLVLAIINGIYNVVFIVLAMIISITLAVYLIAYGIKNKEKEIAPSSTTTHGKAKENINEKKAIIPTIAMVCAGLIVAFIIFFIPICRVNDEPYYALADAAGKGATTVVLISFVVFFLMFMADIIYASKVIVYSQNDTQRFYRKARASLYASFAITVFFFVYSIVMQYIVKGTGSEDELMVITGNATYVPFIIIGVIVVINSIVSARCLRGEDKDVDKKSLNRTIALGFAIAFIGLMVASLFSNIIVIKYESDFEIGTVRINGYDLLKSYKDIERTDYQAFAYIVYASIVVATIMLVVNLALFFRKSKFFYKAALVSILTSFTFIVAIALFGKYYEIADRINKTTLENILNYYDFTITIDYTMTVSSQSMYFAFGGLVMLGLVAVVRPFTKHIKEDALDVNVNGLEDLPVGGNAPAAGALSREDIKDSKSRNFDACPAFSEIDNDEDEIVMDYEKRREMLFANPTLPSLVRFIVEYAKESRLHLSYTEEEIAQFIAGLGSSRLSILQGMSGTGKTSLPKIFAEAILGNADIVEVESSWKDKNELIGYYNEFSGKFTPKKFTQALYRAKFAPEVITFIVLDEMNLSRIEYYFSDFLSLMENEEDKREIKLLNVQLKNIQGGQDLSYKMLYKGHTLKVPSNVWFVGTANRDESTFEISDKVYDRAMTMNFSKRAPKINAFNEPLAKRFLEYTTLRNLLDKAIDSFGFDVSTSTTIKEVEKLLQPYNISFGNRIEKQMESFVSIYCSCFTEPRKMVNEAVEKILLSKVVAKLEFKSVENKEELAHSFEELGLFECASFINNRLDEDL